MKYYYIVYRYQDSESIGTTCCYVYRTKKLNCKEELERLVNEIKKDFNYKAVIIQSWNRIKKFK